MGRVLLLGVATVDFVFRLPEMPTRPEKYRAQDATIVGGGCAANAAVAIARLGGEAVLAGRLGDDAIGDMIVADLEAEGVDCRYLQRTSGARSAYSSIYVDAAAERQIVNFRGSDLPVDTGWIGSIDTSFDAVLTDTRWAEGARAAMTLARARGTPGVIDAEAPVDEPAMQAASHVAFSDQGLIDWLGTPDVAEAARRTGQWCCMTAGPAPVRISTGDEIAAFPITPVDTLGAGDVWHGAFALALAEGSCETDAVRFANAVAALKCLTPGGRSGTPTRAAANAFLRERS